MISAVKARLYREAFITTPLSIAINPFYIMRRGLYEAILKYSSGISGDVLDFGCGRKPYELLFERATSYIGVDIEESGHDHKNSKVDHYYDGKVLPFADESFDAVVCFEVFEHIFNIEEALAEIRRVLKSDGRLLLSIPFAWDEHEVPYDFARYTSYGIAHVLKENGFQVIQSTKTGTYVLAIFQMIIAYLHQHVLPRGGVFGKIGQLAIIFPLNLVALTFNTLLPKRTEYFCNNVVLARKEAPARA